MRRKALGITLLSLAAMSAPACKSRRASSVEAPPADEPAETTVAASQGSLSKGELMGHDHHHGDIPFSECPVAMDDASDVDKLLDHAAESFTAGDFKAAYYCADMAAESIPQSVDAHHIRAAAASALGHYEIARLGFAMALALDPDDPETLAAAAEFYINVLPPKQRDTTMVGLAYARRGRARAVVRRRTGRPLRARLALLEAQAYNDLGRADEALDQVEDALDLTPELVEAKHERGLALFNLCRFEQARIAFEGVLARAPDDPYAHHHLGLIHERLGKHELADQHFRKARELAPKEFWSPVMLSADAFRSEVERAVGELPEATRSLLAGVSIEVADLPAESDLLAVEPPFSPTILGLFRGLPHGVELEPSPGEEPIPDRAIVLYRKNLARAVKTPKELESQIRRTLLHELGHLSGMDEGDLRRRGLD